MEWIEIENNMTEKVMAKIIQELNVDKREWEELKEGPFLEIQRLFQYYREGIFGKQRYLYDGDAVYFYNFDERIQKVLEKRSRIDMAERGDIMMSFWTPFTYFLGVNSQRIISKNRENLNSFLEKINAEEEEVNRICQLMHYLAHNYWTRGNLLLLPNTKNKSGKRRLNPDRYMYSQDKIDQTLWHCFASGNLHGYFGAVKNVIEWIKAERLEILFTSELYKWTLQEIESGKVNIDSKAIEISVENLQPLVAGKDIANYRFQNLDKKEWKEFFTNLNKVIAYRNKNLPLPRLPFEWEKTKIR